MTGLLSVRYAPDPETGHEGWCWCLCEDDNIFERFPDSTEALLAYIEMMRGERRMP